MGTAPLDLFTSASAWTLMKVEGATTQMDAATPCEGWDVRTLLNHMLETQRYFVSSARGEEGATRPDGEPHDVIGDDPTQAFAMVRDKALRTFGDMDNADATAPMVPIAFADTLLHGWDVARATGQDERMPDGLAEAAMEAIGGKLTDDQRKGTFGPEVHVADGASAQDRLLAYTGRNPAKAA